MLIRVRELELRNLEFDDNFQPGAIEFGPDFRQMARYTALAVRSLSWSTADTIRMSRTFGWWAKW